MITSHLEEYMTPMSSGEQPDEEDADFEYITSFENEPEDEEMKGLMLEYEKQKYKRAIIPQLEQLKKELSVGGRTPEMLKWKEIKLILQNRIDHRHMTFKHENGMVYPKDVPYPGIVYVQEAEPHVLITGLSDNDFAWYGLKEVIGEFAEEAYLTYETGLWLASISSAINCCEYALKYELFRHLNKKDAAKLEEATMDYNLTLGKMVNNAYDCLDALGLRDQFYDNLTYLNLVRSSIYHANPEKAKKVNRLGETDIERTGPVTDYFVLPVIAFKVYTIMISLLNRFYGLQKAIEYYEEGIADWKRKRGYSNPSSEL